MLASLFCAVALAAAPGDHAALSRVVAAEAATLRDAAQIAQADPAFLDAVRAFSTRALELSAVLRSVNAPADLPCIFKGIGEDARVIADDLAQSRDAERGAMLREELAALFDDAALLAPQAETLSPTPQ